MGPILISAASAAAGYFVGHTVASAFQLKDRGKENTRNLLSKSHDIRSEFNNRFSLYVLSRSMAFGASCGATISWIDSNHKASLVFASVSLLSLGASQWIVHNPEKSFVKHAVLQISGYPAFLAGAVKGVFAVTITDYLQQ